MTSFIRYAGAAAVVLSLGFLVTALPAVVNDSIPTCTGKDAVSIIFAKLIVDLEVKIKAILACATLADCEAAVKVVVALLQGCADDLVKVGAGVAVEADAKTSIVTCVAAIITLLVKVCVQVSLKFGITAVVALCVQIDVVLKLLLINLNICIDGIVALIAKAIVSVNIILLVQLKLKLCLGVLGL